MFDKIFGICLIVISSIIIGIVIRDFETSFEEGIIEKMRSAYIIVVTVAGLMLFAGVKLALGL